MASIEYNYWIEQVPAAVTDPALGNAVLPRTLKASPLRGDAQGFDRVDHLSIEVRRPIKDQIFRRGIVGECFSQLLYNPGSRRMSSDLPMQDSPPVMRDNKEAVQHTKCQCRHGEESHRSDGFSMIAQKGSPSFCRLGISRRFAHPAQHRSFRDFESEHLQFAVNARSAPSRVFSNHAEDELAKFRADAFPATTNTMSREPCPIRFESSAVPADNSLRLNEN